MSIDEQSCPEKQTHSRSSLFRMSTLLWISFAICTFIAGRYWDQLTASKPEVQVPIVQAPLVQDPEIQDAVIQQVWDPAWAIPIAITGTIDLDGDGNEDLNELIGLIDRNGGRVVAYLDSEGNVMGKMDENTRICVRGDWPLANQQAGFNALEAQKDLYQVREISVREMLNSIGYRSEARIQRFNERAFVPRVPTVDSEEEAFEGDK